MKKATVENIDINRTTRQIFIAINGKDSSFIEEPNGNGFPSLINSAPLVEGVNLVLEGGHAAVNAMKGNGEFCSLLEENRQLRAHITQSALAMRIRQLLSALDYDKLSDYQAKCVLLVEQELKQS
jgi:hypothetical protein